MILIFSPYFREVEKPFANMPCLAGYLETRGISVTEIDANIRFFNYFLRNPGLDYLKNVVDSTFSALEGKQSKLTPYDAHTYQAIAGLACTPLDELTEKAQDAIRIMRTDSYYDPKQYKLASSLIQKIIYATVVLAESGTNTLVPFADLLAVRTVLESVEQNLYGQFYKEQILNDIIKQCDGDICCMLDFNSQLIPTLVLAKMLKSRYPDFRIFAAGDICPHLHDVCRDMPEILHLFDGIITHNYETVLFDICNGVPYERLNYFIYLKHGVITEQFDLTTDNISVHGRPDYSIENLDNYFAPKPELSVYTSSGCYWGKCAFCNIHVRTTEHRQKDIKDVLGEIKLLRETHKAELISFSDEEIPADRLLQIANEILQQEIHIKWTSQTRFDIELTQEEYNCMYRSGCVYLGFGLESGDNTILKKMRTGFCSEQAKRILTKVHKSGIMTNVSVVVGFPSETEKQWNTTIEFLVKNCEYIDSVLPLCYSFTKHSAVEKERAHFGINKVYDEKRENALLFTYPNFVDTYPDWKTREKRLLQLYSKPKLFAMLSREKLPRGQYACYGECAATDSITSEYKLQCLRYDIKKILMSRQYYFSGDHGVDFNENFPSGIYWYLYNFLHEDWIPLTEQESIILHNEWQEGTDEKLSEQLHCSLSKAKLMKILCLKKYQNILNISEVEEV